MSGLHDIGLFVAAVFLLNITPGPDTAYIVARSVAQGRNAGIVSALGIALGCCVHALFAAFGLSALVRASPLAFAVVRYLGAAYLVWLGARLLFRRAAHSSSRVVPAQPATEQRSVRRVFAQGLLTNVLNPKVVLFFVSFFPQFVRSDADAQVSGFLMLGAIFVAMSTAYTCALAWIAGTLTQRLRANPKMQAWLERGTGALFVAIGCKLALAKPG